VDEGGAGTLGKGELTCASRGCRQDFGGYRLQRIGYLNLDKRQKDGRVAVFHASLIERNKYAPGFEARGPHVGR